MVLHFTGCRFGVCDSGRLDDSTRTLIVKEDMMTKKKIRVNTTAVAGIAKADAPANLTAVSDHEARLGRLHDYLAKSLKKKDALEANLGSINSGLMRVAVWLDETIEQAIESGPPSIERIESLLPAIDTQLRVARQVDRFAQIEIRAAEARKPKKFGSNTNMGGMPTTPALPD